MRRHGNIGNLNAASEMLPVTWENFGRLHPFVPLDQAEDSIRARHATSARSRSPSTAPTPVPAGDRVAIVSYVDPAETAVGDLTLTLRAEIL